MAPPKHDEPINNGHACPIQKRQMSSMPGLAYQNLSKTGTRFCGESFSKKIPLGGVGRADEDSTKIPRAVRVRLSWRV